MISLCSSTCLSQLLSRVGVGIAERGGSGGFGLESGVWVFRVSGASRICRHVLKINFSVLVNMYSEKVTSYW
jgi:hypothetical protein